MNSLLEKSISSKVGDGNSMVAKDETAGISVVPSDDIANQRDVNDSNITKSSNFEFPEENNELNGGVGTTQARPLELKKSVSNSENKDLSLWYLGHRKYGEDSFIYKVFGVKTCFEILLLLCPFYHYKYWTETLGPRELNDECTPMTRNMYIFNAVLLLDAVLMFFAAVKFGT